MQLFGCTVFAHSHPLEIFQLQFVNVKSCLPIILVSIKNLHVTTLKTNSFITIALAFYSWFFTYYLTLISNLRFISNKLIKIIINIYEFVYNLLFSILRKRANKFFLFLLTVFLTILLFNIFGLMPFSFSVTSHAVFIVLFSSSVFFGLMLTICIQKKLDFFLLFIPQNVPVLLLPFLTFIEFISYFSRLISLTVRLFANIVSGHVLIYILSGGLFSVHVVVKFVTFLYAVILFPILMILAIVSMEGGIAVLQAYVFLVLLIIYTTDVF